MRVIFSYSDSRQTQLEGAIHEGQKFNASLSDMLEWMVDKQHAVEAADPVSGQKDTLMRQSLEHDTLSKEVGNKDPDLKLLLDKGHKMVDSASPMSDMSDLSEQLDGLQSEYKALKDKIAEREKKLKDANQLAERFQGDADLMKAWLELNEEKLANAGPITVDENAVNKQLKEAQVSTKQFRNVENMQNAFNASSVMTIIFA